jgi:hypothetical protein
MYSKNYTKFYVQQNGSRLKFSYQQALAKDPDPAKFYAQTGSVSHH